jgi:hypothetical protein
VFDFNFVTSIPSYYDTSCYGCTAESIARPRCQVPSPHYWEIKCGKDIDFEESL